MVPRVSSRGTVPPAAGCPCDPGNDREGGQETNSTLDRLRRLLKEFFFGAAYLEFEQTARTEKVIRGDLFLLLTFGGLLGIPILPPYHSLRLLPYVLPALDSWKKRMVKERDLTDIKSL